MLAAPMTEPPMSALLGQFLADELPHVARVDADTDLLAPGMLDSLAIIRLVAAIEDGAKIRVEQSEIEPANLRTLGAIEAFVARKRAS